MDLFENTAQFYRVYASNAVGESPASEIRGDKTDEGVIPDCATKTCGRL